MRKIYVVIPTGLLYHSSFHSEIILYTFVDRNINMWRKENWKVLLRDHKSLLSSVLDCVKS